MKNNESFKNYFVITILTFFLFSFVFLIIKTIEYNSYKENFNNKINDIILLIQKDYPEFDEKDIIDIIESDDNLLQKYGYDLKEDSLVKENDKAYIYFLVLESIIVLILVVIILYLFIKYNLKQDKEINKIIKSLENINKKNYSLDIDELSEDKLSILKEEIYKTAVMLKEEAENSLNDKKSVKNAIQDISHQLKTPLTSIMITLDNLLEDEVDEKTRVKFLKQVKKEINNINNLIQSILKLSRFEANTIVFNKEKVEIGQIIKNAITKLEAICDLKNITIKLKGDTDALVFVDKFWETEAITNILKNAVEYSNSDEKIIVDIEKNNIYTKVSIKDFGKGMDDIDVQNIFKRFYKGKASSDDSTGIGLSLAKVIVEKDGGIIEVSSKKNKGTSFIIKYFKY